MRLDLYSVENFGKDIFSNLSKVNSTKLHPDTSQIFELLTIYKEGLLILLVSRPSIEI